MSNEKITDEKDVYIAWTNTDLTEGRGFQYPLAVCDKKATAIRLGKGKSVQGSDCEIRPAKGYRINNQWYYPGRPTGSTKEDDAREKELNKRDEARQKAIDAGLTDEDILALRQ